MDNLKKFGNRCRELRNKIGLSQEKFAYKIKMDRTYYASVEAGNRNVSFQNFSQFSRNFFAIICLKPAISSQSAYFG